MVGNPNFSTTYLLTRCAQVTLGYLNRNIKAARKSANLTQEEVVIKLNELLAQEEKGEVKRSTYAYWETNGEPSFDMLSYIGKVFGYKVNQLLDEDFISDNKLEDDYVKYRRRTKQELEKEVSPGKVSEDMLMIKAMLRVMLRTQAVIISHQEGISLSKALAQITKAVRDETSAEFDELK